MKKTALYISLLLLFNCAMFPIFGERHVKHDVLLDVISDTQARQLYIDGFEKLTLREKILAYHLVQAGLAGRDIYYDQNHERALAIRNLCEEILQHAKTLDAKTFREIRAYTHRIWLNSSQYFHSSKKKFIPKLAEPEFRGACNIAAANGADFMIPDSLSLNDYLSFLQKDMFDSSYQSMLTIKNSGNGEDIIASGANNFYDNITYKEVMNWLEQGEEQFPSNSRLVKQGDQILEFVYRAGLPDSGIAAGLYAPQLTEVIHHLELAKPWADSIQAQVIENMILFYQTGYPKYASRAFKIWLNNAARVDFLQGFIEVYTDPFGKKGSFQSIVYFEDEQRTELMERLVEQAEYFEQRAPFDKKYKRAEFQVRPKVIAALVISGAGDGGPITPAGINLPNDQKFRERFGSKNLIFTNILGVSGGNDVEYDLDFSRRFVYEFFHPDDIKALQRVKEDASFAMVCLHELIGHGSGKVSPDLAGDPSDHLKEYYSTLEEARAELMALWSIQDPKLYYIGMLKDKRSADEVYRQWARNDLLMLTRMENRVSVEQDHERARHLIVSYLREKGAVDMVKIKGKLYTKVRSIPKFRDVVGELLREIMRIKAEGDYDAAKKLVQKHGIYFNLKWRDQMVQRYKKVHGDLPIVKYAGYSMPILLAERDKDGVITDVKIKYLQNFEKEQLYYSGKFEIR